jgi:SIR2-like domain
MSTRAVLELASRVIRELRHANSASTTHIVPVVVEDVDVHLGLLEEAFRHAELSVVRAGDHWAGAEGRLDPLLQRQVENGFLASPSLSAVGASLEAESGVVRARLGGGAPSALNPGLRMALGLASSLFHDDIQRNSGAAVLAYDEAPLEARLRDDAWGLLTQRLRGRAVGQLRMLVVLVGADLDVGRHCTGEVSCRFAVNDGVFLERRPTAGNLADIRRLANEERLILFLAAGASVSSGMPLGNDMRDFALRHLLADPAGTSESLARAFRRYVDGTGQMLADELDLTEEDFGRSLTLERVLREELRRYSPVASPTLSSLAQLNDRANANPGTGVIAIQEMIRCPRRGLVLVTVNFDTLIHHRLNRYVRTFATDRQFRGCARFVRDYFDGTDQRVPILKLHGTLPTRASIVATIERVAEGLNTDKAASLEALLPAGDERTAAVYVGYSMRDRDVTGVLGLPRYANEWDETWVHPHDVSSVNAFIEAHRRQIWTSSQRADTVLERTITETADTFLTALAAAWCP